MMKNISKRKRYAAVFIALTVASALSGCSEVKEINDMAIVSGIAVDLTADGGYRVSAEIVNKTTAGSPDENRGVISAEGDTLGDALENCNFQDSHQLYFSHLKTLVLSRELVEKDGVDQILDYVMRNYKMRLSSDLLVSGLPSASSVSDLTSSSTGLLYYDLEEMIKTDRRYGACSPTKVYQAVNTLRQKGTALTIPIVAGNDGNAALFGTAVFFQDKMVGTLTQDETLYLLMLQNHVDSAHLSLPKQDMTFQVLKADLDCRPSEDANRTVLNVDLKLTCTVSQAGSNIRFQDAAQLSDELARSVEQQCDSLIQKAQGWNSDIFGFGKSMGNLDYEFSTLPINVTCTINLKLGEVH